MSKDLKELLAAIPTRDDSLRRALEDIERKLSAWSAAMDGLHHASPRADLAPLECPADAAPVAAVRTELPPEDASTPQLEDDTSAAVVETHEPEHSDTSEVVVEHGDDPGYDVADAEPAETPIARPANPDDDESVLVGLSPESAKAIKVQWRLLEGMKSLRQLVEEHKARLVRGDGSREGKRSWWTRGKG